MLRLDASILAMLLAAGALPAAAQPPTPQAAVGAPVYAAGALPDRVVLSPGADAAREMAVAWRTDTRESEAVGELAPAVDSPSLGTRAVRVTGTSSLLETQNGPARHHRLRFPGLQPDTAYVYRLRGAGGWSEWFQFRTAAAEPRPFTFLYFGDAQNEIRSLGSRVVRQAFASTANPALALHAGDLVDQRDGENYDLQWGEWAATGGHHYASVPQLPAAGNHEYLDAVAPDGSETRRLGPHWPLSFALPANGAPGAEATTYFVDYQGVRFIVLDGTAAIDLGALEAQTRWLDGLLTGNPARWTVVLFHQPIFTCARPRDTQPLHDRWRPILENRRVDLVLQGHDHCYGRLTAAEGRDASARRRAAGEPQGPVYVVSVAGPKMYGLNNRSARQPDRVAEETQLYQSVEVAADRLRFRAFTATGRLYDAFDLVRGGDGRNRLQDPGLPLIGERRCDRSASPGAGPHGVGPDGAPCTAELR